MTYDERREIETYLDIIKKNCERLLRSISMMQNAMSETECSVLDRDENVSESKENFIKNY